MKKRPFLFLILLLMFLPLMAHYKARFHVLVDTDGGIADMRALCMMLADPEIEVIGITAVKGTLPADQTINQVRQLLQTLGHEGIPVGGSTVDEAMQLILHELDLEEMPVDLVALGPLDNVVATLAERQELLEEVRTLYCTLEGNGNGRMQASDESDPLTMLMQSGIRMEIIKFTQEVPVDLQSFREGLLANGSRYAKAVGQLSGFFAAEGLSAEGFLPLHEEAVPLYMKYPLQFSLKEGESEVQWEALRLHAEAPVGRMILEMLEGEAQDRSIVLTTFPTDSTWFEPDVSAITAEIIRNHGDKEWRIVCLTNEFHEHLGIYSILGAKMGLRAREYFNVGIDEMTILSYAGQTPPLSCMNDGLQVSTGATLGHGTIQVADNQPFPRATFSFKDRRVTLTVREEFRTRIRNEVRFGVETYGLESEAYWEYIRALALNYWLTYSRFEIFDLE